MKHTPVTRRSPLRKSGCLRRYTGIRARNGERKAKRAAEGKVYGSYHRWIGTFPCAVGRDCFGAVKGHHLKTVGSGGEDVANEVPLCIKHHSAAHGLTLADFERIYGVDLETVARDLWAGSPTRREA